MDDFLFQLTLYHDGTYRFAGRQPKTRTAVSEVLRILAEAIDDGRIVVSTERDGELFWHLDDWMWPRKD